MIKLRLIRSLLSWFKGKQPELGRGASQAVDTVLQGFGARVSFIEKRQQETGQGWLRVWGFAYQYVFLGEGKLAKAELEDCDWFP